MSRGYCLLIVVLWVASCAAPPPTPAPSQPAPAPVPQAPVAPDWRDRPLTSGGWAYLRDARGSTALYGRAGAEADFLLRCDTATRTVTLSRPGEADTSLGFITSNGDFRYPARASGDAPSRVTATLSAADPFLDKLVFSRGRFLVTTAGLADLLIPAWPEPARVVEDCRS